MPDVIDRIAREIGEKESFRERFNLFCKKFGGSPIEKKIDRYNLHGEFRGSRGMAVFLRAGQIDGEVPFQPYVTGTHKMPWQRNLNYVVSSLQPYDIFSELAMPADQYRRRKDDEEVLESFVIAGGLEVQLLVPQTPKQREIEPADFEDRTLVVVRNDIITPEKPYVRRPELARDTFFCAMYADALR